MKFLKNYKIYNPNTISFFNIYFFYKYYLVLRVVFTYLTNFSLNFIDFDLMYFNQKK